MSLHRRQWIRAAAGAAAAAGAGRATAPGRPNILFLLTDDQRFSTLFDAVDSQVQTPHMKRLARRGTVFHKASIMGGSVPAVCAPSRAMLLTGQSLFHVTDSIVEPRRGGGSVARPFDLFPEHFRRNGYRTFGTGKWHNGEALYARCFTDGGNIFFGGMADHLQVPVADFDRAGRYPASQRRPGGKFSSELFADTAIRFLEQQKKGQPFLAYVAFTSPHDPRMAPRKYQDLYPWREMNVPANFLPQHPFDNGELKIRDELLAPFPRTPDVIRQNMAAYYAMITEVDEQIGRVLDALEGSGHAENTVVVLASDNGLALGQHGLMGKQNLYDHSIRVPLILAGPGIPAGKREEGLCYLMDLFPTLCDCAGIAKPATIEGRSLAPVLAGRQRRVRDSVFLAYRHFQRAVRTDRWKLILYQTGGRVTTQLFDLHSDPLERNNLAADLNQAGRIKELRALMQRWMRETDDPADLDRPGWVSNT